MGCCHVCEKMGRRFGEGGVRNHRTRVREAEEEISVFCIFYYLAAPLSPLIKWGAVCVCVGGGDLLSQKQKQRESQEPYIPEVRGNGPKGGSL